MFKKVLIAEDYPSASISVRKILEEDLRIKLGDTDYVYDCDTALGRIKKALRDGEPYELLITDLSFDEEANHTPTIDNGRDLISAAKAAQADIKVLVFSVENKASIARELVNNFGINAYVPKGRRDMQDLKEAIADIYKGKTFLSKNLRLEERTYDFTELDKAIIQLLATGKKQKEIPDCLKKMSIKDVGLSSIEKRLHQMRSALDCSNNPQLIAYCKERNII